MATECSRNDGSKAQYYYVILDQLQGRSGALERAPGSWIWGSPYKVDGIMYKEGKVYVPKDKKLRAEIIRLHHDMPVGGHGGQWKTVELVTRNFWWLGVTKKVKRYVEGCDACQRNKNCTE